MKQRPPYLVVFVTTLLALTGIRLSLAGSATWKSSPVSSNWNDPNNWTPATVPNGPGDIATFDVSTTTTIAFSAVTSVDSIVFNPGASAYIINTSASLHSQSTPDLSLTGAGIVNNSGVTQQLATTTGAFTGDMELSFSNQASAGSNTTLIANTGIIQFFGSSTTASANVIVNGATVQAGPAGAFFFADTSSAGDATFTINPGTVAFATGGFVRLGGATAGNATFSVKGGTVANAPGGTLAFSNGTGGNAVVNTSPAMNGGDPATITSVADMGNAVITANGSTDGSGGVLVQMNKGADGSGARFIILGDSHMDVDKGANLHLGISIGSLEGNGIVNLSGRRLLVGGNNLSTTFSGTINDSGPAGGTGGIFAKTGSGTLTLTGSSNYTGGTTIDGGKLLLNARTITPTGTNSVLVNTGTFGGNANNIPGPVTIGTGAGTGAFLFPGLNAPGTLAIRNTLLFNPDATYQCALSTTKSKASKVTAAGITIESGATFSLLSIGHQTLGAGTVFVVMANQAQEPINGTFANLPDGGSIVAGNNTFQANYEGGNGNDLTLTVIQ